MAYIRIEYDNASAKAKDIQANGEKINTLLTTLTTDMESNINSSTWTGSAAESFKSAWSNSANEFKNFVDYLKCVQSKVDEASRLAREFDQNISK